MTGFRRGIEAACEAVKRTWEELGFDLDDANMLEAVDAIRAVPEPPTDDTDADVHLVREAKELLDLGCSLEHTHYNAMQRFAFRKLDETSTTIEQPSLPEELVEKVARAIFPSVCDAVGHPLSWAAAQDGTKDAVRSIARAALAVGEVRDALDKT